MIQATKKNNYWKTYITDYKQITGESNWLRIESSFKPSQNDINLVAIDKGFKSPPQCIEICFNKSHYVTTFSCEE